MLTPHVQQLIALALEEDSGRGDVTSFAIPAEKNVRATVITRDACTISGIELATWILSIAQARVKVEEKVKNGERTKANQEILVFSGNARELFTLERTILNFLQRSCGVASEAARYRDALGEFGSKIRVTDTRKTMPGWRFLDKQAVRDGGLYNHRFGLDAGVLIKENHIRAAGGIKQAVVAILANIPHVLKIEVEVSNRAEAFEAIEAGAEALLLDNFSVTGLQTLVPELRKHSPKLFLEASGGIHINNIRDYAATGVDCISVGALTHSVQAANLSMLCDFGNT